MRARHRRLWTFALTSSAVILIVTVVVVGGFRLLVKAVPGYRGEVEQRVSAMLDRKLSIRELDLSWRRFRPSLDLLEVTLYGDDGKTPALKLREMNIAIDWLALLAGRLQLSELRLAGLALTVERRADGSLHVSGIRSDKTMTTEDLRRLARAADRVGRLVVSESQLLWLDYTDPDTFHRLSDIEIALSSRGRWHRLQASIGLPAGLGGLVQLEARATGDLEVFQQMEVEAELQAESLQLGRWLGPWLRKEVALEGSDSELHFVSRWQGTRLQSANGRLRSGALQLRRARDTQDFIDDLQSEFSLAATPTGGWRLQLERLSIAAPERSPSLTRGSFEFRPAGPGRSLWFSAALDQLRLDEPGEWLALFDWREQGWIASLTPAGRLQDLRLRVSQMRPATERITQPLQYALQCRFEDLGVGPDGARPGMTGVDGQLQLDHAGGELSLTTRDGQLLAPGTIDQPVPLREVSGKLNWRHEAPGWVVTTRQLRWQGPEGLEGHTDLEFRTAGTDGTPAVDMQTRFSGKSWADVRGFFPRVSVIDEDARHWIQTAIVDGHVTNGHVQMRGLLHDFPYHNPDDPGLFRFDFDVTNGIIDYAEGWPAIDRIRTHVTFQGRGMQITADSGRILGVPVGPVQVGVKDFYEPLLEVDGDVTADAGRMLSFLTESPLREQYAGLVQALKLQGPAKLDLRLEIPLDRLEATRVFGDVALDGSTQLSHAKLPEPITGITGLVRFDNRGLHARELAGDLLGLKLALQLDPQQQDGQHLTRLQAGTEVVFPRDAARLARLVPPAMLSRLRGSSRWQADMLFDTSATPARLQLNSELTGLSINLPPPFGKFADEPQPLNVSLDPSAASGMRADIRYGKLLAAALRLRDSQGTWTLDRGHVRLGEGMAQLPDQAGLWLDGSLAEFDAGLWQTLLTPAQPSSVAPSVAPSAAPVRPSPGAPLLQRADLRLGRLLAGDQVFENLRLQLSRDAADWLLNASGPSIEGTLRWPQASSGRPLYRADLQRLSLRAPTSTDSDGSGADEISAPPRDPATLPGLSLRARKLQVDAHDLGELQLEVVPVPNGVSLSTLSLNGDLQVQGSGSWTRSEGESSAQLSLSARGSRLEQIFAALGYAASLEAEKVRVQASLNWAPDARGIRTESLGGGFGLDLEKGVLMAVEPGVGRVLGLMNFLVLPRRLTLDFRDVVSEGLVFDTLKGDFRLEGGNAWTDNLRVRGPSIKKMEIDGRVGLVARDYDQRVTIQPQVSPGVALAGTIAGGPAVGLALLVGQQLFKKPLEDLSELNYRLHGPWDNPSIEPIN